MLNAMSFIESQRRGKQEVDRKLDEWAHLNYTGNPCPNCSRSRLARYSNGKVVCEKCHWEPATSCYNQEHSLYA